MPAETSGIPLKLTTGESVEIARADLPRAIAIIMDGNGRWAKTRGKFRVFGHNNGVQSVRNITTECAQLGVEQLILYAFSSENWSRPQEERDVLFKLLKKYLIDERPTIMNNRIRLVSIGETGLLPADVQEELRITQEMSAGNTGMVLCLALSYGSRDEILRAVRAVAADARTGRLDAEKIDSEAFRRYFYRPELRDPDLLIRTAGEYRVSNFLLWQISYSEFYVTPVYWPDFTVLHLHDAIYEYSRRERRFGGLAKQV